jgi:hypothetical protein
MTDEKLDELVNLKNSIVENKEALGVLQSLYHCTITLHIWDSDVDEYYEVPIPNDILSQCLSNIIVNFEEHTQNLEQNFAEL